MEIIWTNYIYPFLTFVGFLILYLTTKNLLPGYFNEKGKNIATKEDVSEITNLVETVKHTFTSETEKLKADLSVITKIEVGLVEEERNAIVDYNEKYFRWLNILMDTGFGGGDDYNNAYLDEHQRKIMLYYADFLNSETRFHLFVENKPLVNCARKMKAETFTRLNGFATSCLVNIKHNNANIKIMRETTPLEDQEKKHQELMDKRTACYYEFGQGVTENYPKISPLNYDFQKLCREHIYHLLKRQ